MAAMDAAWELEDLEFMEYVTFLICGVNESRRRHGSARCNAMWARVDLGMRGHPRTMDGTANQAEVASFEIRE
ncbi:MAG TPA: hypothetical protein VGE67_10195 [Haloferula sp.]